MDPSPNRLNSYKRTPSKWKERLRESCMVRLRHNRSSLLQKLRHGGEQHTGKPGHSGINATDIDAIMAEEIKVVEEACDGKSIEEILMERCSDGNQDINSLLEIMDEIRRELVEEEQRILNQYEDSIQFDEEHLQAAIECLQTDIVMCPVCQSSDLHQSKGIIFCQCGIRINTQNEGITLEYVKKQLDYVRSIHSQSCHGNCLFSMIDNGLPVELQSLTAVCQVCDFLEIVV